MCKLICLSVICGIILVGCCEKRTNKNDSFKSPEWRVTTLTPNEISLIEDGLPVITIYGKGVFLQYGESNYFEISYFTDGSFSVIGVEKDYFPLKSLSRNDISRIIDTLNQLGVFYVDQQLIENKIKDTKGKFISITDADDVWVKIRVKAKEVTFYCTGVKYKAEYFSEISELVTLSQVLMYLEKALFYPLEDRSYPFF